MQLRRLLLAVLIETATVTAFVSWKDSVSRTSSDLLRKRIGKYQTDGTSTVENFVKSALQNDPSTNPLFVDLPLDHFGQNPGGQRIQSRYFVQDAYYQPGGPVIFHDIGEGSVEPWAVALTDEEDFSVSTAKRFNGLLILFEHRFYGESAPRTRVSQDLYSASRSQLTEFYKYLTIEQALEDVVYFASNFTYEFQDLPPQQLTPDKTPWIYIGVSYSGVRGAWLAKRNPGLFKATLASSAPVQLKVNFWEYFTAIEDALAINNQNCSADLHAAANWFSQVYQTRESALIDQFIDAVYQEGWQDIVRRRPGDVESDLIWDARLDFMKDAAWTAFADFQNYGVNGGTLGRFCDIMETAYDPEGTPEGVFATETLQRAAAAYAKAVASMSRYSYTSSRRTQGNQKRQDGFKPALDSGLDSYSWLWQVCTEFGAFQVANTSRPENLLPSFVNVTAQIDQCIDMFGLSEQVSRAGPDVEVINQRYQGWYLELPNTLWTNGEFDPWRALSIDSKEEDAPTNDTATTDIPQCGGSFPAGTQLRYLIRDGYHGSDVSENILNADIIGNIGDLSPTKTIGNGITATLRRNPTSTRSYLAGTPIMDALNAQSLWFNAMSSWLPCSTLPFTYTAAQATSSAPFTSRSPFPTDPSSGGSERTSSTGSKQGNAASSFTLPSMFIPLLISFTTFVTGVSGVL
ncbi:hypothetical protein DRE_00914 [Drechslerella stenobrocha 248]|uniref:Serine carboxypeptidase S28-domain-containing protein n=1 Tax=Drechslerella stenobrocha 248 TaxID=1043628 RepID=W7I799_9PEZI|nr:hypothetical protein DRE_00914 [Drechslerella stenobrocha 248]